MTTTVPSASTNSAFQQAGTDILAGQSTQGQAQYQLGALENNTKLQTIPTMEDAAGANGRWGPNGQRGPQDVARGNLDRQVKDQGFNIYSGMFDAMNQMTYAQAASGVGYSAA